MADDTVKTPNTQISEMVGDRGASIVQVYVSSEIAERAPTKDRPEVTYGTTTKASITINGDLLQYTVDQVAAQIQTLHGVLEDALQNEIARRKLAREGQALLDDVPV